MDRHTDWYPLGGDFERNRDVTTAIASHIPSRGALGDGECVLEPKPATHWGGYSAFALLDEFDRHVAQLGIDPASSQQRPPIVKIDLHRSPHGNPSGNRKALSHDGSPSARLMT